MRSRKLKAEIQRKSLQNDFVNGSASWETVGQCYCDVRPLRGREYFDAAQIEASVSHKIATEFRTDITPDRRLKIGERIFNLHSVANVNESNRSLEIMAEEKV